MVDKAVLMVVYTEREEKPGRLEIPVLLHQVLKGTSTKQSEVVNRAIKTRTKSTDPPPTPDATARAELNILVLDS
jgi:hypothetical protein